MPRESVRRGEFRKASNYYLALASEWGAPLLRAAATVITGAPSPKESWRKGLIIGHTHIGDLLYRTASLPHLASALPECSWDYLAAQSSAPVLLGNPAIAHAIPLVCGEDSWNLCEGGYATLREEIYDVALCTNSLRNYPDFALAVGLGIPNRVGYADRGLSGLITHPIEIERPRPFPAYFREMVKQLCGSREDWPLSPAVSIGSPNRAKAESFLGHFAIESGALIACCPTTRQPSGSWPQRFFLDVINAVADEIQIRVLLCGTRKERPQLEHAASEIAAPNRVMAGELDLLSYAALLSNCDLVFSQDSAARHLGNAVGTPVSFLRNLAVNAIESGKYCDSEEDLAPDEGLVPSSRMAAVRGRVSAESVAARIVARIRAAGR